MIQGPSFLPAGILISVEFVIGVLCLGGFGFWLALLRRGSRKEVQGFGLLLKRVKDLRSEGYSVYSRTSDVCAARTELLAKARAVIRSRNYFRQRSEQDS